MTLLGILGFLIAWVFIFGALVLYADSFQTPVGMTSGDVYLHIFIASGVILLAFGIVASVTHYYFK